MNRKIRYYSNVTGLNLLALLFLWFCLNPLWLHHSQAVVFAQPATAKSNLPEIITGTPVRLVMPELYIDLPVEKGLYSPTAGWTLHDLRAYYAIYSSPANNSSGNTFIYGHNNYQTLGAIKSVQPGMIAKLYTASGHIFIYKFINYKFVEPNDLSVFSYRGKPILTIQTCTGVWNETRGMFKFDFVRLEK